MSNPNTSYILTMASSDAVVGQVGTVQIDLLSFGSRLANYSPNMPKDSCYRLEPDKWSKIVAWLPTIAQTMPNLEVSDLT